MKSGIDIDSVLVHTDMTDHFTPFVFVSTPQHKKIHSKHETEIISKKINYQLLDELLKGESWIEVLMGEVVQNCYNIFIHELQAYLNEATITNSVTIKKNIKIKTWNWSHYFYKKKGFNEKKTEK